MTFKLTEEQIVKKWILTDAQLREEERRMNIRNRWIKLEKIINRINESKRYE